MSATRFVRAVSVLLIAFAAGTGLWAFLAPRSFYDQLATFPPYNRHLIHDIGAFSIGLGAAVVVALMRWSGIRVALWAAAVANVVHAISHIIDRDLGGKSSDPWTLSGFAVLTVVAAVLAAKLESGSEEGPTDATAPSPAGVRPAAPTPQHH